MENKKKLSKLLIVAIVLVLLIGTCIWSIKIAPTHFALQKTSYINANIPEGFNGFKIAFISDIDLSNPEDLDYLEKCVSIINKEECDMVIFGGDIYETKEHFDSDRLISILKSINVKYGKLAVLGENEIKANTEDCIHILEKSGFEVLRNNAHYVYSKDSRIVIAGLENNGDVDSLLTEEMKTHFILSVVHQPDYFTDIQNSSSQLQLSGHSAGGFINIPFIGGVIRFDGSQTYVDGTEVINEHTLMISNGIGLGHDQKARFNCDPNALIITLRTSK